MASIQVCLVVFVFISSNCTSGHLEIDNNALASQKIAISSSTGTRNGFVSWAINIYHMALHI